MKKSDVVDALAGRSGISKSHAQSIVEDILELIAESLSKEEDVDLNGFGSFRVEMAPARTGVNPQTGEPINVPAHKVVHFKPDRELRERVAGS